MEEFLFFYIKEKPELLIWRWTYLETKIEMKEKTVGKKRKDNGSKKEKVFLYHYLKQLIDIVWPFIYLHFEDII